VNAPSNSCSIDYNKGCLVTMSTLSNQFRLAVGDRIKVRVRATNNYGTSQWSASNSFPARTIGMPFRVERARYVTGT
jgi:hypothetical protein